MTRPESAADARVAADSPIVIGGLGGSGTRVPAEALIRAGVDMGRFLVANDNLVFTALFKRPGWYARSDDAAIHRALDTFVRYSFDQSFGPGDLLRLARSVIDPDPTVPRRETLARVRAAFERRARAEREVDRRWGWKEPNSHIYLPQLIDHFPGLRFVYMARHGLDMAYSENKNQLGTFGSHFGFPIPTGADDKALAMAQLGYWIAMTRRAVELGTERLGDRFLFLRYDDLCRDPEGELARLLLFAGVEPADDLSVLAADVTTPSSLGRWRTHADRPFTADQIEAVRSFGFDV